MPRDAQGIGKRCTGHSKRCAGHRPKEAKGLALNKTRDGKTQCTRLLRSTLVQLPWVKLD
jgi:hypothetical protein